VGYSKTSPPVREHTLQAVFLSEIGELRDDEGRWWVKIAGGLAMRR
jgi:hypothetical protein